MEGYCLTGQRPQWAVVPMEEEEVNYLDKMKDHAIIIGDLNINIFKQDSTKKKLELLINMSGLQAVINGLTTTKKQTKCASNFTSRTVRL
jgi:phosphopentomutase